MKKKEKKTERVTMVVKVGWLLKLGLENPDEEISFYTINNHGYGEALSRGEVGEGGRKSGCKDVSRQCPGGYQ